MKKVFVLIGLLISAGVYAQIPNYVPTNSLVAYWPFDGNANDVSGNGNNGTANGAVLTTDRFGGGSGAYDFPNTAANCGAYYIQANVNTTPITTSGAMTLSFWIKREADGCLGSRVMELGSCTTCPGQILATWVNGSSTMTFRHYVTTTAFVTYNFTGMNTGNWYHIVYTNDGDSAKFYQDGNLVNSILSPAPAQLSGNVAFGRMNHPSYDAFNGDLDDIGLWSRALTPCEINALHTEDPSSSFAYNALQDTTFICDTLSLNAGAGYSNYSWSSSSVTIPPAVVHDQQLLVSQNGEYNVTVTNGNGCTASDSTQIIIIKPVITADKNIVCKGGPVMLSATGIAGSSQTLVKQFYLSSLQYNQQTVPTVIGGNYTMTVSGIWSVHFCTDANNVADAAFYYERNPINALPGNLDWVQWNGSVIRPDGNTYNSSHIYNYTVPPATQTTQTFTFVDPSDNGSHTNTSAYSDNCDSLLFEIYQVNKSNATYTWSANPAATAGLTPADINKQSLVVTPTATTTYYVTVNDGITSCEDSITVAIATVDTSLQLLDPAMTCQSGGSVRMNAGVDNTYKWLLNSNPIPAATLRDLTATQSGIYRVVVTNGNGCTDTSRPVTVTLYPQPVAAFAINNDIQCLSGNNFVFTNASTISSGTLSYQWDLGDGQSDGSLDPSHSYTTVNTFSVKLITTSDKGCKDSITKNITVNSSPATPFITAAGVVSICQNSNVILSSDTASGNQWYKNGAAIMNETGQTYNATTAGTYIVITTGTGNCISSPSNSISVTVSPTPLTPNITPAGPLGICANQTITLSSDATSGDQWYKDGTLISGATNSSYTASSAGTYTVTATVNNCPSNSSAGTTITIAPTTTTPSIATNGPVSFCGTGTVVMTSNAITGNQWYNGGQAIAGATDQVYSATSTGTYTVVATETNSCPSDPSNAVIVNITLPVYPTRYSDVNTYFNMPTVLQARTFGDQYTWIPATGLNDATNGSPIFNSSETIDYVIQITTNGGCVTYDSVLVKPYTVKGILMPTAFTPNNDGLNDILHPFLIDVKQLLYFRIYNKWGQLIFESSDPSKGWDGSYKGSAQPTGNYVWVAHAIDNDGKIIDQHGQVVLIR